MTHGQSDTIPGQRPIVVPGPEPITPLQAFEAHLLRTDVTSKYLHVSPALRQAGREEWLEMMTKIERQELAIIYWQEEAKSQMKMCKMLKAENDKLRLWSGIDHDK